MACSVTVILDLETLKPYPELNMGTIPLNLSYWGIRCAYDDIDTFNYMQRFGGHKR